MDIALVYQGYEWKCGPASWTAHLFNGLKRMGYDPAILKIDKKPDEIEFNELTCYVMPRDEVLDICSELPSIICIAQTYKYKNWIHDLLKVGCAFVYHTRHNARYSDVNAALKKYENQIIAVRPAIRDYAIEKGNLSQKKVTYIPHMYIPKGPSKLTRTKNAVCITRIAAWKNVDIIAKANNILMDRNGNTESCVWLHGNPHESYVRKNFVNRIRGWDDTVHLTGPMYSSCQQGFENGKGYDICNRAGFAVDLTNFPGDNADLQYCALEMIDAGCVYIGHTKYIDGKVLVNNHNCLSVSDPYELVEILMTSYTNYRDLTENARMLLEKHKPENVIHYYDELFSSLNGSHL